MQSTTHHKTIINYKRHFNIIVITELSILDNSEFDYEVDACQLKNLIKFSYHKRTLHEELQLIIREI